MSVSFTIMAHPARGLFVKNLMREIPSAEVCWAEDDIEWNTGRASWELHDPHSDWHVVVQDDALVCKEFEATVTKALAACPEGPVSLYAGKPFPEADRVGQSIARAKAAGKHWFTMQGPVWGVCIAAPTKMIGDLLEHAEGNGVDPYDLKLATTFGRWGMPCWYSVPSLVDHRISPSMVNNLKVLDRQAHEWIGYHHGLKIDWDTGDVPYAVTDGKRWVQTNGDIFCGKCVKTFKKVEDVLAHHFFAHDLGPIDMIASSPDREPIVREIYEELPEPARGNLYVVGSRSVPPRSAKRIISRSPIRFTVIDGDKAVKFVQGRQSWSVT